MDAWEFSIAIADMAGGEWSARARSAALELSGGGVTDNETATIKLLADIRDIFGETNADTLFSSEISKALAALNNRPWAEWGRDKKPISATAITLMLSPLLPRGVKPGTVRKGEKTRKGYHRRDLEDTFLRYLPPKPPSETSQCHNPQESSGFLNFQNVTANDPVTLVKSTTAAKSPGCGGVTFQAPPSEGKSANGIDPDTEAPLDHPRSDWGTEGSTERCGFYLTNEMGFRLCGQPAVADGCCAEHRRRRVPGPA
jgi:hypothetical protein